MKRESCLRHAAGFVLLPVVLALTLLASVAVLMNREGAGQATRADADYQAQQARYLAEAALERQTWRLQRANCAGYSDLGTTAFGSGSHGATVGATSGSPVTVTAVGTAGESASRSLSRTVKVYKTSTQTLNLQPDAVGEDGWITATQTDWNYGAHAALNVNASSQRTLIRFDLSSVPVNAKVVSASLGLYATSAGSSGDVLAYRLDRDWIEGTCGGTESCTADGATWTTYDGAKNWALAGGDYFGTAVAKTTVNTANAWSSWDLTDTVVGWLRGDQPNYGVMLVAANSSFSFVSSDSSTAANRPKLTLSLVCECGRVCVIPTKPVARWLLDETSGTSVSDSDGGHTGTLNGGVWGGGRVGGGLHLNGTSVQYVTVPVANGLNLSSFTLAAWIRPSALPYNAVNPVYMSIVSKGTTGSNFQYNLSIMNKQINLGWINGALFYEYASTTAALQTNTWYHVAGSYDASRQLVKLYLNGTLLLTQPALVGPSVNSEGVTVGRSAYGEYWQGALDDVRIYSSALTDDEIAQIHDEAASQPIPAQTQTLMASADTYLMDLSATNSGTGQTLIIGKTSSSRLRHTLLKFDLSTIPPGSLIQSAKLRLYQTAASGSGSLTVGAYRINQSWTETGANWLTADGLLPWLGGPGGTYVSPAIASISVAVGSNGWYEWELKTLAQSWVDGLMNNHGIQVMAISPTTGRTVTWSSDEGADASRRPQLVVTYQ